MIHVNRNRETLGKFTDQEVADGLKSGRFLPGDLAWKEPMSAWQPLSTFTDLPEAGEDRVEEVPVLEAESPSKIEPAWERATGFSLQTAFETVRQVFSNPASTFKNLPAVAPVRRSFFYFLLMSVIGSITAIGYDFTAAWINPDGFLKRLEAIPGFLAQVQPLIDSMGVQGFISAVFVSSLLFQPVFLIVWIFVFSLLAHLFLLLAGAAERGWSTTFRALAYATGTGYLLQLLPLVGIPLSWVAFLVFGVIALKEAHHTSFWRVGSAFLLLVMLSCGLIFAIGIGLGMMVRGGI